MLQQTQVARVLAAWPAFIARFPTPAAMAAAPLGEVIGAWDRLGYPRRARRLWEAATVVTRDGWPDDLATLPGVGRYTAAAIHAQADRRRRPGRRGERAAGGPAGRGPPDGRAGRGGSERRRRSRPARSRPVARAHGPRRRGLHRARTCVRGVPTADGAARRAGRSPARCGPGNRRSPDRSVNGGGWSWPACVTSGRSRSPDSTRTRSSSLVVDGLAVIDQRSGTASLP